MYQAHGMIDESGSRAGSICPRPSPFMRDLGLLGLNGELLDFQLDISPVLLVVKTDKG